MGSKPVEENKNERPNETSRTNRLACKFPALTDGYVPDRSRCNTEQKTCGIDLEPLKKEAAVRSLIEVHQITLEAVIATAWALTIARYIGADEVFFYVLLDDASGWNALVCDLAVYDSKTQLQLLRQANERLHGPGFRGTLLREVVVEEARTLFPDRFSNTAIIFKDESSNGAANAISQTKGDEGFLVLNILKTEGPPSGYLTYQNALLSIAQAANIGTTFTKVLSSLRGEPHHLIRDVDYMSQAHIDQIWKFNSHLPEPWSECFHDIVERHAINRPWSPAIDSWDAKFTFKDLMISATRLARHLQDYGVGPGVVVPICFERSAWALVAMLAISKAGGAFVSVPPFLPPGRRAAIIEMIASPILLTTSDHGHLWDGQLTWVAIEGNRINCLPNSEYPLISRVKPSDMFYVIFTSGSTGLPKGCVLSHTSFINGALRKAPEWNFGPDSRVLQMLSHTFDMSLLEICTSLGSGACVCIPRAEEIEKSLATAITKYGVTLAVMTPSLARRLEPEAVPGLKTLCLGGEAFPRELVTAWSERINLFQFYGPSECSINSSTRAITTADVDPLNIGTPNYAACWVVMPDDHNRLVPIGSIGELLVSGSIVGLGYFKDPLRTAQVFLDDVAFVQDDPLFRGFRFYKTGDLVRWNSDGTLTFCGRSDTQVKLNGQRLELGEVEYHLALDENVHLAMALVPKTGRCYGNLVAIIALGSITDENKHIKDISVLNGKHDRAIREAVKDLRTRLQNSLPRYMVPTIWAFISRMPMSNSGKIDRVIIRKWIEDMTESTFLEVTGGISESTNEPSLASELEQRILEIWSNVLNQPQERIGLRQPFVSLGGDSISAQQIVARCRENGIKVTMVDTLTCEGVAEAAFLASSFANDDSIGAPEFDLNFRTRWDRLQDGFDLSSLGISRLDEVEDVYPCTPMQEGMFISQMRRPGSYHLRFFYKIIAKNSRLPGVSKIRAAWHTVVSRHPTLRTVFVEDLSIDAVYDSIVLRQPRLDFRVREILPNTTPSEAMDIFTHLLIPFNQNSTLHRLTVCVSDGKVPYFLLEASHALVDGAAMEVLVREFVHAFNGRQLLHHGPAYRDFVAYQKTRSTKESAQYWNAYLQGSAPSMFPVNTQAVIECAPTHLLRRDFDFDRSEAFFSTCKERRVTAACVIRATWALVLRTYTGSRDICFGYVSAGRDVPVKGIDQMLGLCLSAQPCRVQLEDEATLASIIGKIQQDYVESLRYQHYPLAELQNALYPNSGGTMFNTAISMEWVPKTDLYPDSSIRLEEMREQDDPTEYDIAISIDLSNDRVKLGFLYWPSITEFEMTHIGNAFKMALNSFLDYPDTPIDSLSLLGHEDVVAINHTDILPLNSTEASVLKAIESQTAFRPDTPAILSWDGEFSFRQAAELSSKVAMDFIARGINRGDHIVTCIDKSCWSIITILAIMRSGASFVAVAPSQPQRRLKTIIEHCHPKFVITEPKYIRLFDDIHSRVVTIYKESVESFPSPPPDFTLPSINKNDKATIIYTSGSTGEPKAIVMDHGSLATSALVGHGNTLGFSSETRVLQFASFTFDASLLEIFTTLVHGGCICVPSEDERLSDLSGCINRMQANWSFLTPSVARIIKPEDVPSLKTLVLGGEPMSRRDVQTWATALNLYNGYGPAETTIFVSVYGPMKITDDPTTLGCPVRGTRFWVTEVGDDKRLAPIGCTGELVVQSRQVAEGYLNDVERTAAAFIKPPEWLKQTDHDEATEQQRLYKTGDLVRYNPDGSLSYVGRKDTQTKLRGQRVELSEVECQVSQCLPEARNVVAEVITLAGEKNRVMLAAFVSDVANSDCTSSENKRRVNGAIPVVTPDDANAIPVALQMGIRQKLIERMPSYMIPAVFFALPAMPLTTSGKTDRNRLREMGATYSIEQLAEVQRNNSTELAPITETERHIQQLWAQILGLASDRIGVHDNFFHLGGDSIAAMKLAATARHMGIVLSVADVFRQLTISKLAQGIDAGHPSVIPPVSTLDPEARSTGPNGAAELSNRTQSDAVASTVKSHGASMAVAQSFSLLGGDEVGNLVIQSATQQCHVTREQIEDIYPCTPLQEGLMSLTAQKPGAYVATIAYPLPAEVDQNRFQQAWDAATQAHPILRSRIIQVKSQGGFQVVLRGSLTWEWYQADDTDGRPDLAVNIGLKTPLLRLAVVSSRTKLASRCFLLAIHHAAFDGWSLPLLLSQVEAAYQGVQLQERPFSPFITYLSQSQGSAAEFWKTELADLNAVVFPPLPYAEYNLNSESMVTEMISIIPITKDEFTISTRLKLAWAVIVSQYTSTQDVVFGVTTSGRAAPVLGIEWVVGPTIATIPTRIHVDPAQKVVEALRITQNQFLLTMPYEHMGLQNISRLGPSAAAACRFQTLLVIQPEREKTTSILFAEQQELSDMALSNTYALVLLCELTASSVKVQAIFDSDVVQQVQIQRLLRQFQYVFTQLTADADISICQLNMLHPEDLRQLVSWNRLLPDHRQDCCVHDLIHQRCVTQPNALALSAWDGDFTYKELDELSSILAFDLHCQGVSTEVFVPLYLGRSRWTAVSQLAVMKAGGAFVFLDPSNPLIRLQEICKDVKANLIVASKEQHESAISLGLQVIMISDDVVEWYKRRDCHWTPSSVTPNNALYAVFTSGSTGKPKGIVIEHKSFYSSAAAHIKAFKLRQDSRVLQFSSYVFDASIVEHLSTLLAGGCICIPSELDRKTNLANAASKFRVNWACLTPSVARCIDPWKIPTLRTLVLVGEPMTHDDIKTWSDYVYLINGYGPAECSAASAVQTSVSVGINPRNIGRANGGVCWIVSQQDPEKLLPIGAIGELLIEGPIVGRGYLNDDIKTAESFLKSLKWLTHFRKDTNCWIYKTGDLAQYMPDGTIRYVGRKDTQVKLRGQRIELLEVEHHLRNCYPSARDVVVDMLPARGNRSSILVAFIWSTHLSAGDGGQQLLLPPTDQFLSDVQMVEAMLNDQVPAYMVPSVFIPLSKMPLTKSGKTDRFLLCECATSLSRNQLQEYKSGQVQKQAPTTENERILRDIWARVLEIPSDEIGVNENFFRRGGDSISGMQVSTECNAMGITVRAVDVFRYRTIRELAAHLQAVEHDPATGSHEVNTWVELSPVQQIFFDTNPDLRPNYFNQSFFLRLEEHVENDDIARALEYIVAKYSVLRTRFRKSADGTWARSIMEGQQSHYRLQTREVGSRNELHIIASSIGQIPLDAGRDPLFALDLINSKEDRQHLLFVAHYLIVDLVSWRIILEDFEDQLKSGTEPGATSPPPKIGFHTQVQNAARKLLPERDFPDYKVEAMNKYFGEVGDCSNTSSYEDQSFSLDEETTTILFGVANKALNTEPVEILHAALLHSFIKILPNLSPTILVEGHGRELWDPAFNSTRAAGWFTSVWPTSVALQPTDDIIEVISRTKDGRRRIPANGWAYFPMRYLSIGDRGAPPEIIVKYLGFYPHQKQRGTLMRLEKPNPETAHVDESPERSSLIDISVSIVEDCLTYKFLINGYMKNQTRWVKEFELSLREAAERLTHMSPKCTLSDFPLLSLTYDGLDEFLYHTLPQSGLSNFEIEDIYPCSPVQRGILLSQARNSNYYQTSLLWEARSAPCHPQINVEQLRKAWEQVVERHAVLRTVFMVVSRQGYLDQVVLKKAVPDVQINLESKPDSTVQYRQNKGALTNEPRPPHKLIIRKTATDAIVCELEISHALIDEISAIIIKRDLALAYEGRLSPLRKPLYSDYISFLQENAPDSLQEYWRKYLEGIMPCHFPSLNKKNVKGDSRGNINSITIDLDAESALNDFCRGNELTVTNVFHIVWALVLQCYTSTNTVCFGYITLGRDLPVRGIRDAVGPFFNMMVRQVHLPSESPLLSVLLRNQEDYTSSLAYQHCPLVEMNHSQNLAGASLFNTVVSLRSAVNNTVIGEPTLVLEDVGGESLSEYDIAVDISMGSKTATVSFTYWTSVLSDDQASAMAQTFRQALIEILNQPSNQIGTINLLSKQDWRQIAIWNEKAPEQVDRCIHDLIHQRCSVQPEAPAVCAWDGTLTYRELDALSSALARQLVRLGIGPEKFVPLYFEKSVWAIVAIIATLKAGGAFVLLDPSYPMKRMQAICQDLEAELVIASAQNAELAEALAAKVITVDENLTQWQDTDYDEMISQRASSRGMTPENAAYAMFTSGSTGKPKGVVIEHRTFCSTAKTQAESFHLTKESRVLQFASYAFDATILEILTTLIAGGCVCVPSDFDRLDNLAKVANQLGVNWSCLTSSVARLLRPEQVPTLKTLVLAGEMVTESDLSLWSGIQLIIAYGLAECAVTCVVQSSATVGNDPKIIGHGQGAICWIVDRHDHTKLLPIGAVGELILEGPVIGRGYIGDPVKTKLAFIEPPHWRSKFLNHSKQGRFYKTGDLVQYASNGSIRYLGRKDTQIKLRGQRIELGDVESHVRQNFPHFKDVVAEAITLKGSQYPLLVVFLWIENYVDGIEARDQTKDSLLLPPTDDYRLVVAKVKARLYDSVPSHMIPTLFLPISHVPLRVTGKTDRQRLCDEVASLPREKIEVYSTSPTESRKPASEMESLLQRLYGQVLGLSTDKISADDSFFQLGGDSLTAMKLSTMVGEQKLGVSLKDIFHYPKISDLATRINGTTASLIKATAPFSLLPGDRALEDLVQLVVKQCNVGRDKIEDIYPCTALQEGLMALTVKKEGVYMAEFRYQLPLGIDLNRFRTAWTATAAANPILRTRIVQIDTQNCLQAVMRDDTAWQVWENVEDYNLHKPIAPGLGRRLLSVTVIKHIDQASNDGLILTVHHAIYDGWSLPLILNQVEAAYHGEKLQPRPFSPFIKYSLLSESAAKEFWEGEFAGIGAIKFPSPPSAAYQPSPSRTVSHRFLTNRSLPSDITASIRLRLAWAILISKYTDSNDVVFGATVTGRGVPVLGIEQVTGPTIATVPIRLQLDEKKPVLENLRRVQDQFLAMIPFEQTGLQNIGRIGEEAAIACQFQSLLVVQPDRSDNVSGIFAKSEEHSDRERFNTYSMALICQSSGETIEVHMSFDDRVLEEAQARRILHQFAHILQRIDDGAAIPIAEIGISLEDRLQIERWNMDVPMKVDSCVHEVIYQQYLARPDSPAVCAWDGNFTYKELKKLSSKLAWRLINLDAHAEMIIPVCFDKSKWIAVALLGILQAGAAFVLLDSSHPLHRRQEICKDVEAGLIISSVQNANLAAALTSQVVEVGDNIEMWREEDCSWPSSSAAVSSAAYISFTSGSTGKPKGTVIEHCAFATAAEALRLAGYIDSESRVLQFAPYAFDAAILEILATLCVGGCVCIPSDTETKDNISTAITKMRVNTSSLTPTVAKLLRPEHLPSLNTLVLGGEPLSTTDIQTWHDKVQLISGYGPTECTICCAATRPLKSDDDPQNLGSAIGCATWIVDPYNHNKLAPIGAIGELLIEGSIVGRGYINDPLKTAATFIRNPPWLQQLREGKETRLYKTGDLVRYAANGTIRFIGRKDTQVKLRGQRIELGEVEYHIRNALAHAMNVIVEVINPSEKERAAFLLAFIWKEKNGKEQNGLRDKVREYLFEAPSERFRSDMAEVESKLRSSLPSYMVPAVFLPLSYLPLTKTGKTDRQMLQKHAAAIPREEIDSYSTSNVAKRMPSTAIETKLQRLLARVINIPDENIGLDDNFFRLGGDSIGAMMLMSMARQEGLELSVPNVFKHPKLSDLALTAKEITRGQDLEMKPDSYSLLNITDYAAAVDEIVVGRPLQADNVLDVLPTTELQREYIHEGQSNYFLLEIPGRIDLDRLEKAIHALTEKHSILRTVFVPFRDTTVQVILRHTDVKLLELSTDNNLISFAESACRKDSATPFPSGTPHFRAILVSQNESLHALIFRLSHAQYDGVSLPFLCMDLATAYQGTPLTPGASFSDYIARRAKQSPGQAFHFWRDLLKGSSMTHFDPVNLTGRSEDTTVLVPEIVIDVKHTLSVPNHHQPPEGITMATMHKTAWAMVLARETLERDLVFGQVVNGRNNMSFFEGGDGSVESVLGLCVHIIPVRVVLTPPPLQHEQQQRQQPGWTVLNLLRYVQDQHAQTMAFETVDLEDIVTRSTEWQRGTRFGSVVQYQNFNTTTAANNTGITSNNKDNNNKKKKKGTSFSLGGIECTTRMYGADHTPRSIYVGAVPSSSSSRSDGNDDDDDENEFELTVNIAASSRILGRDAVDRLLRELCDVIADLMAMGADAGSRMVSEMLSRVIKEEEVLV